LTIETTLDCEPMSVLLLDPSFAAFSGEEHGYVSAITEYEGARANP
jgi:hypothetical protein